MSNQEPHIERDVSLTVEDGGEAVKLTRLYTPKGVRLELDSDVDRIRLDALALESVSWQDSEDFPLDEPGSADRPSFENASRSDPIEIVNEFAQVHVHKLTTSDGEGVEIKSPKLHFSIRLGARDLASLTRQDKDTFSSFLQDPYGPEDEH